MKKLDLLSKKHGPWHILERTKYEGVGGKWGVYRNYLEAFARWASKFSIGILDLSM